jgi:hypothetical protein
VVLLNRRSGKEVMSVAVTATIMTTITTRRVMMNMYPGCYGHYDHQAIIAIRGIIPVVTTKLKFRSEVLARK